MFEKNCNTLNVLFCNSGVQGAYVINKMEVYPQFLVFALSGANFVIYLLDCIHFSFLLEALMFFFLRHTAKQFLCLKMMKGSKLLNVQGSVKIYLRAILWNYIRRF